MKKSISYVLFLSLFISAPLHAKKPEGAGAGKPQAGQKAAHEEPMKMKEEKSERERETVQGLEKQRIKKEEQEQKESGKGSEQGQESRESRKKWWKFWGE
jgi:hypothetical protein